MTSFLPSTLRTVSWCAPTVLHTGKRCTSVVFFVGLSRVFCCVVVPSCWMLVGVSARRVLVGKAPITYVLLPLRSVCVSSVLNRKSLHKRCFVVGAGKLCNFVLERRGTAQRAVSVVWGFCGVHHVVCSAFGGVYFVVALIHLNGKKKTSAGSFVSAALIHGIIQQPREKFEQQLV